MKSVAGWLVLLAAVGLQIYLWGTFILNLFRYPLHALQVIVVPSLCFSVIAWTFYWFTGRSDRAKRRADERAEEINQNMQNKTTEELYDIVMSGDRNEWTEAAIQAARDQIRLRAYAEIGISAPRRA